MSDRYFSVENQVVLVSGASRGIGLAIALGFAERGAKVVISSRNQSALDEAGSQAKAESLRAIACDVGEPKAIQSLVDQVRAEFGRIDTLINVAGVNRRRPAIDFSVDEYDWILDTNLKGAFLLSQTVGRVMIEQGRGNQINIGSLTTDRPLKQVAPYAMSKAALGQMTRALALEWGPRGVRVNAIAPGFILTDMTYKLWSDPTMHAWGKQNTPLGRLGRPEDMVGAALFLASEASAFMTGQILYVDGGFTAGWAWPIPVGGGQ